jgi:hypothetical protein
MVLSRRLHARFYSDERAKDERRFSGPDRCAPFASELASRNDSEMFGKVLV